MELVDLMKKIGNNEIPHFLILFGEEQKILDIYIDNIVKALNGKMISAESVSSVIKSVGKKSIDKSIKVYIVNEDSNFTQAEDKWENVKKAMNKNYIIIISQ